MMVGKKKKVVGTCSDDGMKVVRMGYANGAAGGPGVDTNGWLYHLDLFGLPIVGGGIHSPKVPGVPNFIPAVSK